jgi:excisionase family DNA binding protein
MGEEVTKPAKPARKPKPPPRGVRLYRVEQAAWLLQMSVTSVRRLVAKGLLPYRKTVAGVRFIDADIDAYIAQTAECKREEDTPERRAAKRAKARGMIVDPEFLDDGKRKGRGGQ